MLGGTAQVLAWLSLVTKAHGPSNDMYTPPKLISEDPAEMKQIIWV
jgi:hypothetical protein